MFFKLPKGLPSDLEAEPVAVFEADEAKLAQ